MSGRGDMDLDLGDGKRTHPDSTTNEMNHTKMARMENRNRPDTSHHQMWLHNPDTNVRYFKTNQAHKAKFTTQKAFYIEITNEDFKIDQLWNEWKLNGIDWKNMFAVLKTPYYYIPWWYICWYLHLGEYKWLKKNTSKAKILKSNYQVNVVGHRLPFTTNDTSSSVANSLVDQTLDVFRGMNKVWPNYPQFKGYTSSNPDPKNTVDKLVSLLYGNPASHTTDFQNPATFLGATQKYMDFPLMSHLTKMTHYTDVTNKKNMVTGWNDYTTFPDFAKLKYADCDLKLFRGPIAQVEYRPKHGWLNVEGSILDNAVWGYQEGCYGITNMEKPVRVPRNEMNFSDSVNYMNGEFEIFRSGHEEDSEEFYYQTDLEVLHQFVGKEVPVPKYDDLWVGVRPVYNGSQIQAGICQLEIRTEIEIEYETFWPAPVTSKWNAEGLRPSDEYMKSNASLNNGLTNETDLLVNTKNRLMPLDRPKNIPTVFRTT